MELSNNKNKRLFAQTIIVLSIMHRDLLLKLVRHNVLIGVGISLEKRTNSMLRNVVLITPHDGKFGVFFSIWVKKVYTLVQTNDMDLNMNRGLKFWQCYKDMVINHYKYYGWTELQNVEKSRTATTTLRTSSHTLAIERGCYSISQDICTRFLLCCALLWLYIDWFSHIHQAYFTGTVAI